MDEKWTVDLQRKLLIENLMKIMIKEQYEVGISHKKTIDNLRMILDNGEYNKAQKKWLSRLRELHITALKKRYNNGLDWFTKVPTH